MTSLARSFLYVPGNAPDKLEKARGRGADALIVDLEDAVPVAEKEAARQAVLGWLADQSAVETSEGADLWVRVNSGALRESDVVALACAPGLTGLVLAKVASAAEVAQVVALLAAHGDTTTLLSPLIETGAAVLDAAAIAAQQRVHVLQLGEVDLAGDLGLEPGPDEAELAAQRAQVVIASAAAGLLSPPGPVSPVIRDLDWFRTSTERVRRQGFLGRACIHPGQVEVVHQVFAPSVEEIDRAHEVLDLVAQAEAQGRGVVVDRAGRMLDPAVTRAAHRVLALAERARA
ncbi:MAG TPA: CoA ester lyase [Marmoricola sp.]|nr:CoA ester lyase [Marmoricola sp.]